MIYSNLFGAPRQAFAPRPVPQQRHDPGGMGLEWLQLDPAEPAGWRVHTPDDALLRRPLLLIGGWHDPHLNGVLDLFGRSLAAGGRPQLCIGAWSHLDWRGGPPKLL